MVRANNLTMEIYIKNDYKQKEPLALLRILLVDNNTFLYIKKPIEIIEIQVNL
jgi:hypothetical protein